jgi:signal peptidase II
MSKTGPRDWGLVAATAALIADQGSKFALLYGLGFLHMAPTQSVSLLPFFNLVMVWNPGISYGLFPASSIVGTAILALVSTAAIAGLGYWLWGMTSLSLAIGVGLVIGGALGNLIDRLVYGRVADFFHLYSFGYDFYVFNVADVAITFGAVAIIYEVLKPQADA